MVGREVGMEYAPPFRDSFSQKKVEIEYPSLLPTFCPVTDHENTRERIPE